MKVAIDCRFIGKSGIGTYIENFVDSIMVEHPEYQYLFICEKGHGLNPRNGVEIFETAIKPFSFKELLGFPVDVINECDVFFSPNYNLPFGIKIPVFCTIHDVIFLDRRELTSWIGFMARKFYLWNAVRMSKAIFTVSEFSKNRIQYHFNTKKKIIVTYSAISSAIKEASQTSYIKNSHPYIIYVGNIKTNKGLRVLLEGFQKAVSKGFLPDLYLVGNADKFKTKDNELNQLIRDTEKVKFTGFVSNKYLFKLIAESELLVLPSYYEGFGLTPLEGLYLGTEVLVSDIDVLKEVYSKLPVTFFKCGNAEDLSDSLINFQKKNISVDKTREMIDSMYNTSVIASTILSYICSDRK